MVLNIFYKLKDLLQTYIFLSDDTPHIWNDTVLHKEAVRRIIFNMTDKLLEAWPDKMIYSALGNHDWHPKNKLPPTQDPFYDDIADKWAPWLPTTDADATFRNGLWEGII